jgi:hypothetical protein
MGRANCWHTFNEAANYNYSGIELVRLWEIMRSQSGEIVEILPRSRRSGEHHHIRKSGTIMFCDFGSAVVFGTSFGKLLLLTGQVRPGNLFHLLVLFRWKRGWASSLFSHDWDDPTGNLSQKYEKGKPTIVR